MSVPTISTPADHPSFTGLHTVQFFDDARSLGKDVARFFSAGLSAGEGVLVAARPLHVQAVLDELTGHGWDVSQLVRNGRLAIIDAETALRGLMSNGRPSAAAFDALLAGPVRRLAADGPLRVFGELVDVLAGTGNVRASQELEQLWNQFLSQTPIRLHCGYTAATFADARAARAMHAICCQHTGIHKNADDRLAEWLLSEHVTDGRRTADRSVSLAR